MAPGAYEIFFVSLAHTEADLERCVALASRAAEVAKRAMTTALRSQGWVVRPSFVVNGPTSPVTLLSDETSLTQLAGEPAVAWQTPWSEFTNVVLVRFSHSMALFATTNGVRYCWRKHDLGDLRTCARWCWSTAAPSSASAVASAW